ncbi:polysaccharide biosynthesis tyrosine autokinase [Cetobacterium somerae]|uniref:polysaccharide biosynthesis tyrosine autokinase n=1 Tax=Cetobacterium somerae TaxID=188913 RepID=UPI00211E59B0
MVNSNEFKIDFVDIAFVLKRRWKIILISVFIMLGLGVKYISNQPTLYSAQGILMIRNNMFDDSKKMENMATLLEIAKSKSITQRVVNKYGLHISPGALAAGIDIYPVRGTEFIKLSYTGTEPALTAAIANEVANEFIHRVEEILNRSNLKVLEPAEIPKFPVPVKKFKILSAALVVGLALGMGLAMAIELFNRKIRRSEEIEKILETKAIGVVPNLQRFYPKKSVKRDIFFDNEHLKEVTESIRLIRTNVNFIDMKSKKVVVFSSSVPKEGKTTIASNYALSEAMAGKKVIILDCDIKRPRLNKSYDIASKSGIVDLLLNKKSLNDVITKNVRDNLDVIVGGKAFENSTELFLNGHLEKCINELKEQYDLVVIDTPPLAVATDGAIISQYADGMIFIVSYDQVHKVELEFAKKILTTAKAKLYGVVINKVSNEGYSYGEYGYYSYNYTYYKDYYKTGEEKNEKKNAYNVGFSFISGLLSRIKSRRGFEKS